MHFRGLTFGTPVQKSSIVVKRCSYVCWSTESHVANIINHLPRVRNWTTADERIEKWWRGQLPDTLPWVRKIPWRKKWQPTPVFLPGKSHGQRSLVDCKKVGHKLETKQQLQQLWSKEWPSKAKAFSFQCMTKFTTNKKKKSKGSSMSKSGRIEQWLKDMIQRIQFSPATWKETVPVKTCVSWNGVKWRSNYLKTHLDNRFTKSIEIKHRYSQTWLKAMVT